MFQKTYAQSLMTMDINEISKQINSGRNLNRDAGGFRVFEVLLDKNDTIAKETMAKILNNPDWNPNYRSVDGLSPAERAVLHHREGIAQKVIEHPNFNGNDLPRLIQLTKIHATPKFKKLLARKMQNQR